MSSTEVQLLSQAAKDENFETIYGALAEGLRQNSVKDDYLKVTCEFEGEKRVVQLCQPVLYEDLVEMVGQFGSNLTIQVQNNGKGFAVLKDQTDLDQVLVRLDQDSSTKGLHIRLLRDPSQVPKSPVPVIISRSPPSLQVPNSPTSRSPLPSRNSRSPIPMHLSPFQENLLDSKLRGPFTHSQSGLNRDSSRSPVPFGNEVLSVRSRACTFHGRRSLAPTDIAQDERTPNTFPCHFRQNRSVSATMPTESRVPGCCCHSFSSGNVSNEQLSTSKPCYTPRKWKKGRMLGAGAFGQVFLCYDEDTGRELAVKQVNVFCRESEETSKEMKSLRAEIKLLQELQHPRIVQYMGSEDTDGVLSIFMEYLPGGSIKDQIKMYGPLTETLTRNYTHQMLEGLVYLHDQRIIHRDIKGANVLRDHEGNIKLGDFGASKRLQVLSQSCLMTYAGTPYYMSPELIDGRGYGRRTDIWSLGCTVVEMLTGHPPWHKFEGFAAIYRIATSSTPEYELSPQTSQLAKNFLSRCFIRDYQKRPLAKELLASDPFVNLT